MSKKIALGAVILAGALLSACAVVPPGKFIRVNALSMSNASLPNFKSASPAGPVNELYCVSEHPLLDRHGFIDEVVKKAEKKTGAKFIANAEVKFVQADCVRLTGTAMK